MSWGKPNKSFSISSSAPALSTRRSQPKLAPIGAAPEKALRRTKPAGPPPNQVHVHRKLDALGSYVIETGCYDMVDAMLQAVLVERPSAALPFLVNFARTQERAVLAVKLEQGKVLKPEEMNLLRSDHASLDPESAKIFEPVDPIKTKLNPGPMASGGPAQRQAWADYLGHQQTSTMLQSLMREILQKQPASPLAFTTRWLEATLETQLAEAKVMAAAEKVAKAEREAAEAEAALQVKVTPAVATSEVLLPGRTPLLRVVIDVPADVFEDGVAVVRITPGN